MLRAPIGRSVTAINFPSIDENPSEEAVPAELPPARDDSPLAEVHLPLIPLLLISPSLLIVPRRVGHFFAASRLSSAAISHVFFITLGCGLILWAEHGAELVPFPHTIPYTDDQFRTWMTPWELIRAPFSMLISALHGDFLVVPWVWLIGVEFAVFVLAVLMMPWLTAGERLGRLFGRSVRLTYWSTVIFLPVGIIWLLSPLWRELAEIPRDWNPIDYALLAAAMVFWTCVLMRAGRIYRGPADGPAWQSREPHCNKCYYVITGLTLSGKCPECGTAISESFRRRTIPAFASTSGKLDISAFLKTTKDLLINRKFFPTLSLCRPAGYDRTFFLVHLFGLCVSAALIALLWSFFQADMDRCRQIAEPALAAASIFLLGVTAYSLFTFLFCIPRRICLQSASIVSAYVLSKLILLGQILLWVLVLLTAAFTSDWTQVQLEFGVADFILDFWLLAVIGAAVGTIPTLISAYTLSRGVNE